MKLQQALLINILGSSLLAPVASAQSPAELFAQLDEQLEEFRNRGNNGQRVQNDLLPTPAERQEPDISMREASDRARDAYPGRVLSVRLDGRRWRVRMDEEGTVFNVFVDSENGQVSRPSE